MTTAFLYAAGRALRLGPEFSDRPKILLEVGRRSLLEWHASRLTEVGIERAVLVVGHRHELVVERLPALAKACPINFRVIVNKDYTEGSVLSLAASIPDILAAQPPVLLMDGDVIYPAEILRQLLSSPHASALLIDRNFSNADDDPVLVPIQGGRPVDFIKKWRGTADAVGESIGFFKLAGADIPLLVEETNKRLAGDRRKESYDEVLRALVLDGRLGHVDVTGVPWTEIDFPEDVEFARRKVLPAIRSFESCRPGSAS